MIKDPDYLQRHIHHFRYPRSSFPAYQFSTQKYIKNSDITDQIIHVMTLLIITQYYCLIYLRTNSQLSRYWYHCTAWNAYSDIRVISHPQCNLLFNQENNLI